MTAIVARSLRRTSAQITFEDSYPAMEATPGNLALLAQLDQVSRDLGFGKVEACDPRARGAGDADFDGAFAALRGLAYRGHFVLQVARGTDEIAWTKKNVAFAKERIGSLESR